MTVTYESQVVEGENWWLELAPVDLNGPLVTIQKEDRLIAAIASRSDGRLRVSVFEPLDDKAASILIALSVKPHPVHGVAMRKNNWEYALDGSAGMGQRYAAERGESYISFWEYGIGVFRDGTESALIRPYKNLVMREPSAVATELLAYDASQNSGARKKGKMPKKKIESIGETAEPQYPPWKSKRQQRRTISHRFLGCMLGGAVGDALRAPIEFMKHSEVIARFGHEGLTHYAPAYGGLGKITDDTQMALFTAEGLLRGWVRGCFKGITSYTGVVANAYLRWLKTQGEVNAHHVTQDGSGWLFAHRELHSRRAPGNTCLSALRAVNQLGESAKNDSKGCGGVMRVAPVGLFGWHFRQQQSPQKIFRLADKIAAVTHGHPTGTLPAGVLAVMVMALTDGASLQEALACAKECLRHERAHGETLAAIELAEGLAQSSQAPDAAIRQLGQGWVAEEALAIAIYCSMVARSFRHGVVLAVNHDGDSDSTGAITGNILGTIHGLNAIPQEWLESLELRLVIAEIAEDLYAFTDWNIGEYSTNKELNRRIWEKYPGF